ncbi:hypothetical protein K388_07064 [Streptomyces sp. KhCrAH-43]|nr:hypothetical protein [Streptomyces sp. SID4920]MYX64628.1 hypothetical protein [Streptomyces sp. SID8373]RAJ47936.1 hypothetical protein K388_07064 [Streptomyces sp. KhCrAH-43]
MSVVMDNETAACIARHDWFETYNSDCFALIEGADENEVIRRFGGDPSSTDIHGPEFYGELMQGRETGDVAFMLRVGTAAPELVFAIENGFTGVNALRSLSQGGARALSILTHVNGADIIGYAVDGRLVVHEEPWGPLTPLSDPDPDPAWDPAWCADLTDPEHDEWLRGARQLVLAERVMGLRIDPRWFEIPLRTILLPDPFSNPVVDWEVW